jgi:hypothetical protein
VPPLKTRLAAALEELPSWLSAPPVPALGSDEMLSVPPLLTIVAALYEFDALVRTTGPLILTLLAPANAVVNVSVPFPPPS